METTQEAVHLSGVFVERVVFNTDEIAQQFWEHEVLLQKRSSRSPGLLTFEYGGKEDSIHPRDMLFFDHTTKIDGKKLSAERIFIRTGSRSRNTLAGRLIKTYNVYTKGKSLTCTGILISPRDIVKIFFENV